MIRQRLQLRCLQAGWSSVTRTISNINQPTTSYGSKTIQTKSIHVRKSPCYFTFIKTASSHVNVNTRFNFGELSTINHEYDQLSIIEHTVINMHSPFVKHRQTYIETFESKHARCGRSSTGRCHRLGRSVRGYQHGWCQMVNQQSDHWDIWDGR